MNGEPAHSISKRGRLGEGRPTKRTPEVVARIAEAIAIGLKAHWRKKLNPPVWTYFDASPAISRGSEIVGFNSCLVACAG